jgi:hypothetical protein
MTSEKLVMLIQNNADELTKRLCRDLLGREETTAYRNISQDVVYGRAFEVYSRLDAWLQGNKTKAAEFKGYFEKQGEKRFHEGISLHEEIMVLMLIKRHLWLFVTEKQFFDSTYELQQALQFNNRVVLFFDRVIFHVTNGYQQEMLKSPGRKG